MLVLERTVRTAPPLSGLIASVEPARSPVAAGCLSTPAGCPRPSSASGVVFLLGTLLGLPQWSKVGKIKHLLSAHIFPRPNSQNLSGVLFRKEFSSLKCWEIYKIKTELKNLIQEMGLEGHRKEDDSLVEFSFFQSWRKGGWWAN